MRTKILTILGLLAAAITVVHGAESGDQPKMNGKLKVTTLSPEEIRYTGKPYSKALGAYVFNYRNYDPQTSRWTTPDASGFPNGPNNRVYAPIPTAQIDRLGLWVAGTSYYNTGGTFPYLYTDITDRTIARDATDHFTGLSAPLSAALVNILINATNPTHNDYAVEQSYLDNIVANQSFQAVRNYVDNWLSSGSDKRGNYDFSHGVFSTPGDVVSAVDLASDYDLGHSLGRIDIGLTGTITPTWDSSLNIWGYGGNLSVSFNDAYDFDYTNYQTAVFARLQGHGWTTQFNATGIWDVSFSGAFESKVTVVI